MVVVVVDEVVVVEVVLPPSQGAPVAHSLQGAVGQSPGPPRLVQSLTQRARRSAHDTGEQPAPEQVMWNPFPHVHEIDALTHGGSVVVVVS